VRGDFPLDFPWFLLIVGAYVLYRSVGAGPNVDPLERFAAIIAGVACLVAVVIIVLEKDD
jgi:hypothetical protein